jgi:hypothetical protein
MKRELARAILDQLSKEFADRLITVIFADGSARYGASIVVLVDEKFCQRRLALIGEMPVEFLVQSFELLGRDFMAFSHGLLHAHIARGSVIYDVGEIGKNLQARSRRALLESPRACTLAELRLAQLKCRDAHSNARNSIVRNLAASQILINTFIFELFTLGSLKARAWLTDIPNQLSAINNVDHPIGEAIRQLGEDIGAAKKLALLDSLLLDVFDVGDKSKIIIRGPIITGERGRFDSVQRLRSRTFA